MTVASQETTDLAFESEEARLEALNGIDERDPSNEPKLDAIMNAPIKSKNEAATDKPANSETAASADKGDSAKVELEKQVESIAQKPASTAMEDLLTIKKSELPEGFDSFGKFAKSYKEAQELIQRQTSFIKEKLAGGDENFKAALQRAEAAEAKLKEFQAKFERPAQQETRQQNMAALPESNLGKIREVRAFLQELIKDPIANEEQINQARLTLDDLWIAENERSQELLSRAVQRAEEAEQKAAQADSKATTYVERSEYQDKQKQAQQALLDEFKQMDTFVNKYPEFKMTKTAGEIEREYVGWAAEVTALFYNAPVNVETKEGRQAMQHALTMLERGAPDITEKCRVAGVPVQPNDDIKKYLEVCDLLDYRDGYRIDPITGKKDVVKRYHAPTGQMVPDTFPSLEAAYENRKILDGHYEKKIRDSFAQGGAAMAEAIAKRDSGAVEMSNAQGVSKQDAGLGMTQEEAAKLMESIDERSALMMKRQGDPTLFNKLNQAYITLGMGPLDI